MRRKRGLYIAAALWFVLLWCFHVVQLNRSFAGEETVYRMEESFQWNGLQIYPLEAHLYTEDEYESNGGVEGGFETDEYYVICVRLRVTNRTGEDIPWDTVFDQFGYGFETRSWCGVADPFLTRKLNVFSSDIFADGATQEFWLATIASRLSFSARRWEMLDREAFYYVMDVQPHRRIIRLEWD